MKFLRTIAFLLALLAPANANFAIFQTTSSGTGVLPSGFSTLTIGGGGFVREIIRNGSSFYSATDTSGAFKTDAGGIWHQLFTASAMSGASVVYAGNGQVGGYGIAVAATNPDRLYTMRNNILYTSTNATSANPTFSVCTNWVSQVNGQGNSNDGYRLAGGKIVVDPNNEQVVLVSTQNAGAWYSLDGCANFTKLPSPVTSSDAGGYIFAFEPHSGTTSGKTNGVYAVGITTGVVYYTSGTVTGTWSSTSGPTFTGSGCSPCVWQFAVAYDGTNSILLLAPNQSVGGSGGYLYRYNRGGSAAWEQLSGISGNGNGLSAVAVDPTNEKRVVVINVGGTVLTTTPDISIASPAWTNVTLANTPQTDVPWLGFTSNGNMTIGGSAVFDSSGTYVYAGAGIGVFKINPATQTTWISQTAGIENLTSAMILSPPWATGHPIFCGWDRMMNYVTQGTYPTQNQVNSDFNDCFGLAASVTGNVVVGGVNYHAAYAGNNDAGYSVDSGKTYTLFPSEPNINTAPASAGTLAASNVVHVGSGNIPATVSLGDFVRDLTSGINGVNITALNSPSAGDITLTGTVGASGVSIGDTLQFYKYSNNQVPFVAAATASNIVWIPGEDTNQATREVDPLYTDNAGTNWHKATFTGGNPGTGWFGNVAADANTVGNYWLVNTSAGDGKVRLSTDNGHTFAPVSGQTPANLTSSLLTAGENANVQTVPGFSGHLYIANFYHFIRSLDSGVTWNALANCPNASSYGFGKIAAGHTYPTLYAVGCSGGAGDNTISMSVNADQATPTFTTVGTAPWLDQVIFIAPDWNIAGQFYFIYSGSSAGGYHP